MEVLVFLFIIFLIGNIFLIIFCRFFFVVNSGSWLLDSCKILVVYDGFELDRRLVRLDYFFS